MSTSEETKREIVITGVGVVAPCGIGRDAYWESIKKGQTGIGEADLFEGIPTPGRYAAQVKEFSLTAAKKQYLKAVRKNIKVMCRDIQLGVASAIMALGDSGLEEKPVQRDRLGILYGANLMLSGPDVLFKAIRSCVVEGTDDFQHDLWGGTGLDNLEPLWLLKYLPNMPACHIGIYADARGPNNSLTLEDAAGNLAVGEATRVIRRGQADIMVAGSTGTRLHPVKSTHAMLWDKMAQTPNELYRPFDLNRTGEVVGEGSAAIVLEERSYAEERNANILGYVRGNGSSCVINTKGEPNIRLAIANSIRAALRDASLTPDDIGSINAHGLGKKESDIEEAGAIHDIFGERGASIPVTALKGYIGNSGAGNGSLELVASILGLQEGLIPATLNYETPDPDCNLNIVHGAPLEVSNKVVLNLSVTRIAQASATIVEVV